MSIVFTVLAVLALIAGAAGTIYPALPGLPLMFGGAWLLGYVGDYNILGTGTLIVLFVLTLMGTAADFLASTLGAKRTGASKSALWGAFFGSIAGLPFGLVGLILGPLMGAALGEFLDKRCIFAAGKVGLGTFVGFIVGTSAKIGVALSILAAVLIRYVLHWLG